MNHKHSPTQRYSISGLLDSRLILVHSLLFGTTVVASYAAKIIGTYPVT